MLDFRNLLKKLKERTQKKKPRIEKIWKKYPFLKAVPTYTDVFDISTQIELAKWQKVYSIFFIALTIVIIFTAIYFNVFPPPYKPNIHLSTNYPDNNVYFLTDFPKVDFLLYIYNQGSGACIDARLNYPPFLMPSIRPQKIFRQYTDVKNEIKDNFNSSVFLSTDNSWRMGILGENEAIVIDLIRRNNEVQIPQEFTISVTCNNGESTSILIKDRNYNLH